MIWTIDTGRLGATGCEASELRDVLEDAMAHHAKTAPAGAFAAVIGKNHEALKLDLNAGAAIAAEAAAAQAEVEAKLPKVQEQMKAGITAACALAEHMGGKVTCTVTGHHLPEHPGGIFKRVSVFVDRAAPTEDD